MANNDKSYWERHARGYDLSLYVLGRPFPRMRELAANAVRGAKVLEVAAGTGMLTVALAKVCSSCRRDGLCRSDD